MSSHCLQMGGVPHRRPRWRLERRGAEDCLEDRYKVGALLGRGAYGTAQEARCTSTGAVRAVKCVPARLRPTGHARLAVEIDIARQLDHPNLVRLYETFREPGRTCLVMQLCAGGELFDRIMEEAAQGFPEERAAAYASQIFSALSYLHAHGIAHRDIKPENHLLENRSPEAELKIIDFGLASRFEPGVSLRTKVGTPFYVAPEVLKGAYSQSCDVWSAGVITYVLLCGYPPFHGKTDRDVLRRVKKGAFDFPAADWGHVSEDAKDLITELLTFCPKARVSASAALRRPWLADAIVEAGSVLRTDTGEAFAQRLQDFFANPGLRQLALMAAARQLPDGEVEIQQKVFRAWDVDGAGVLSLDDLCSGLIRNGLAVPSVLDEALRRGDGTEGEGGAGIGLDYTSFLAATVDRRSCQRPEVCLAAFQSFDLDGDGRISMEELAQVSQIDDMALLAQVIQQADLDGDGCIDFEEFCFALRLEGSEASTEAGTTDSSCSSTPKGSVLEFSEGQDKVRSTSVDSLSSTAPSSSRAWEPM